MPFMIFSKCSDAFVFISFHVLVSYFISSVLIEKHYPNKHNLGFLLNNAALPVENISCYMNRKCEVPQNPQFIPYCHEHL